ncbi:hypothetical protein MTR67_002918 [Solanum verrucosum]|uniref:Uncharacterized protein n=1 Tax=Solanum verrucosum TaxID=315347 RepID=A0AAF0T9W6_SOLVR|nr:hypothetical protein MTR67_002918 [Solanum verrucosum]
MLEDCEEQSANSSCILQIPTHLCQRIFDHKCMSRVPKWWGLGCCRPFCCFTPSSFGLPQSEKPRHYGVHRAFPNRIRVSRTPGIYLAMEETTPKSLVYALCVLGLGRGNFGQFALTFPRNSSVKTKNKIKLHKGFKLARVPDWYTNYRWLGYYTGLGSLRVTSQVGLGSHRVTSQLGLGSLMMISSVGLGSLRVTSQTGPKVSPISRFLNLSMVDQYERVDKEFKYPCRCVLTSYSFGRSLSPVSLRHKSAQSVSYYALFQWWLLLVKPPGCLCTLTSFITKRSFRGLNW